MDNPSDTAAIKFSHRMLEAAARAKAAGHVKDYVVVCLERDPRIIDHITWVR